MPFKKLCLFIAISIFSISIVTAQEATIPNLTGLTIPDAAAVLHRIGLELGSQQVVAWDESQPANTITAQNPPAGEMVAAGIGFTVDVTVMRPLNARLVYDDNDFTLINESGQLLNTTTLTFIAVDSNAGFTARRWNRVTDLPANECLQLWSVVRTGSKEVTGCRNIPHWISTSDPDEHFWMVGQQTAFKVIQDGIERGVCRAAPAGQVQECPLYLPLSATPEDVSEYLYLTYTSDQFVIINRSAGRWLPAASIRVGDSFSPEYAGLLAPGQCLVFVREQATETPLETCDVMARTSVPADEVFWRATFRIRGGAGRERHSCPAVASERMICIVPR